MSDSHCLGLSMDNKTLRVSSNEAATSESASDAAGLSKIRSEQLKVVATLSHELRTPLHAIMGLSELLQSEEMSYTARRHIEKINSASQGLLDSLNKAIEAARSESGDLVINPVPSNLLNIVEETAKTYSIAIEGKGLELGLLLDPNLYGREVEVDRVHLQQILNNLLGNAIKFTDTGSIHLWVALKRDHGDRLDVVFSVEDTGIGIPENKISEILSPFGQVVDATPLVVEKLGAMVFSDHRVPSASRYPPHRSATHWPRWYTQTAAPPESRRSCSRSVSSTPIKSG